MSQTPAIAPPPGQSSNLEHPHNILHTVNLVTQVLCIVVVTLLVILRLIIKVHLHKKLDVEDYITFIGWAIFIGFCICMILLNKYGGGYHIWDITKEKFITFQKYSYATTIIYVPMVCVVKLSLLSIMLRIFAPDRKKVLVIWIGLGILMCYYIPAFFIKVFFCKPISTYWYGPEIGGKCIDQQKVVIADSVISVASDLWILILPLPMIWSLHMSKIKKLRVMGVLGAGGLATAFSIWRLVIMVKAGGSTDITLLWTRAAMTANAEAGIGLVCACLPMLSSFWSCVKNSSSANATYPSNMNSRELDNWQKSSTAKRSKSKSKTDVDLQCTLADQAHLISTIEGPMLTDSGRDEPWLNLPSRKSTSTMAHGFIHKGVTVSQSYEFVRTR